MKVLQVQVKVLVQDNKGIFFVASLDTGRVVHRDELR